MKKVLISFIAIVSLLLVTYGSSYAISGACVNCHTMHNSQNGTRMADQDTPYENLLRAGCISCHTGPVASERINSFGAPIVLGTGDPGGQGGTSTLAGGDFWWVQTTDSMGHNVVGIAGQDAAIFANIGFDPPGWDPAATPGILADGTINNGIATWSAQLNCAGQLGCHGKHDVVGDFQGVKGAHHSNTGGTSTAANNPTTIGGSFRFLSGINGLEHTKWNYNESASSHNEYYGYNDPTIRISTATGYANQRTISYLCAECHGVYHSYIDAGSLGTPWLRHPTDIVLGRAAGTEYSAYTNYSVEAPVARPTVPGSSSATVVPTDDSGDTGAIVMCLSCHRAHGSNQADLLRWDYTGMVAGTTGASAGTGCFTCHTTKDGL